ncbi:chromate transporter [Propionivibrio dicarboxylicus]|uniref:Chromate transporter n=1 Tax=Propionivibrio dicarboxylicus TaxID=83767 RepID=A0A1G7XZ58_9RHOO|nr:chromate transporter [Propionivibrio dicarboxylicus]SDG89459.1 chromate transporter [Propionivibrio dicarboxylicus]
MTALMIDLQWHDWLSLFLHYAMLSLISIGGVITTVPEMHRYLVDQHAWLTDAQFNGSIAIAQAAPGPNMLFVGIVGWNIGLNAGGFAWAAFGLLLTLLGTLLPSSLLTYFAAQWGHRNRELRAVRAFKLGMGPIVVALLVATGWILAGAHRDAQQDWRLWLLSALTVVLVARYRVHILWLLALGGILGASGWI